MGQERAPARCGSHAAVGTAPSSDIQPPLPPPQRFSRDLRRDLRTARWRQKLKCLNSNAKCGPGIDPRPLSDPPIVIQCVFISQKGKLRILSAIPVHRQGSGRELSQPPTAARVAGRADAAGGRCGRNLDKITDG